MTAKRKLTNIKVDEISFVDKAANKRAYLIMKNEEDFKTALLKAVAETTEEDLKKFVEGVDSIEGDNYDTEEVKKFFPMPFMNQGMFNPFMMPGADSMALMQQMANMVRSFMQMGTEPEAQTQEDNLVGNNFVTEQDKLDNFQPEMDMVEKGETMTEIEIQKAIDEAVAKAAAEAREQAEAEAQAKLDEANAKVEALAKAVDDQRAKEFIAKAEGMSVLGVDGEFGKVLKALADADSESYAQVEEVLLKAVDALNKEELTEETGQDAAQEVEKSADSVDTLVNNRADEIQGQNKEMPRWEAVAKATEILISEGRI